VDSSVVGYHGGQDARDEERSLEEKDAHKRGQEPKKGIWTAVKGNAALVTAILALLGVLITGAINTYIANKDQLAQQKLELFNAQRQQEVEEQKAQDAALQTYLGQMGNLLLERKLLEAEPGDPVHTLAQARTSTVILRLDAEHNESVNRFLINSGLAQSSEASPRLLKEITLSHATLSGAYLPNADLSNADLSYTDLRGADLSSAEVSGANLSDANLSDANLRGAHLSRAGLGGADMSDAFLFDADLRGANLSGADLHDAYLGSANLRGANLRGANLSDADLSDADLGGAKHISNEKLEQQAKSLKDAYMPNGQKYEDWIKDKQAQGKDEKNE
jgi:uncharacterized protein YjbI with pentapeptide repeats